MKGHNTLAVWTAQTSKHRMDLGCYSAKQILLAKLSFGPVLPSVMIIGLTIKEFRVLHYPRRLGKIMEER